MSTASVTVRAHAHETLDALVWRQSGSTAGLVEATLAANPGLAKLAADLPQGQAVRLQQAGAGAGAARQQTVYLWD